MNFFFASARESLQNLIMSSLPLVDFPFSMWIFFIDYKGELAKQSEEIC